MTRTETRLSSDEDRRARPEPEWMIDGVLPPTGLCQVFGDTYTGKSFVVIDLALRICNGMDNWYGHKINRAGPVVYCFMEGVFDQQRRIDAWVQANQGTSAKNLWTLDEKDLDLSSLESITELRLDIQLANIDPALVIVDTQSLGTPGVDENDNTAMGRVLSLLKRWSTKDNYPVMTVHHTGYDKSHARGASAWKAGLDLQVEVQLEQLKATKVKGGEAGGWKAFALTPSAMSAWAKPGEGSNAKGISQQILDLLTKHPLTFTKAQVLKRFGNSPNAVRSFEDLDKHEDIYEITQEDDAGKTSKVWEVAIEFEVED